MNIMLESIEDLPKFKKIIDQATTLINFIYDHEKILTMMRAYAKKRDIFRSGVTRFASSFQFLQRMSEERAQLNAMFTSNEWERCKFAKTDEGRTTHTIVLSMEFWDDVTSCLQVFGPLMKVLRLVDENKKSSMGFVYGEIMKAIEEIKTSLNNIAKNYLPIINVIDAKMKGTLNTPLYPTAYLLNPFYHYRDRHMHPDVVPAIIDCLEPVFPNNIDRQSKIMNEELLKYVNKESLFGRDTVVAACMQANVETFDPCN